MAGSVFTFLGVAVLGPVIARPVARVIGWPIARLRHMPGVLARDNAMRNPKRTASTAAALMIGVGLVAFILIFWASATDSIRGVVNKGFVGDYVVQSNAGFDGGLPPSVATQIGALPEVATVAETRNVVAEVDGNGSFMLAVNPQTFGSLADLEVKEGSLDDLAERRHHRGLRPDRRGQGMVDRRHRPRRLPRHRRQGAPVVATFGEQNIGGTYLIGLPTVEANTQVQVDSSVYVKLAPGVSSDDGPHGDRDGHRRLSQRPGPEQGRVRRLHRRSGHLVAAVRDRPAPAGRASSP